MTAQKLKRVFFIPAINVLYLPRQISTMIDEIENQIFNREEKEISNFCDRGTGHG